MKRFSLVIAALISCGPAIAQAATPPVQSLEVTTSTPSAAPAADTKVKVTTQPVLPAVTVNPPKKSEAVSKFSKCDLDCRMKIVAATLEQNDCRSDLGRGFRDKQGQAVIMKIPTQDALEARVEELCKEFIDKADKIAEDLKLDETATSAATESEVDSKPAAPIKEANGYGRRPHHGRLTQEDEAALARIAIKTFGPAPTPHHSFVGVKKTFMPVRVGCREKREKVTGGTMVRVVCGAAANSED